MTTPPPLLASLVERLRDDASDQPYTERHEAATALEALAAERDALKAENARLREAFARLANGINVVGSPYHKAQEALDEIILTVKQTARATLNGAPQP